MEDKRATRADWEGLKARLARARAALEHTGGDREAGLRRARILAERARAIAAEPPARDAGESIEVLEFALGAESYAVETSAVAEVQALKDYTPVPCAPEFVLGILNVRGRIVSVLDLRPFFGLPRVGLGNLNRAVLLRAGTMEFGILADAVRGARRVQLSDLQPPLPTHVGAREKYLRAIGRDGLLILDSAKLLSDPAIVVREHADHDP